MKKQAESVRRDSTNENMTGIWRQSQIAEHQIVRQISVLPVKAETDLDRGRRIR